MPINDATRVIGTILLSVVVSTAASVSALYTTFETRAAHRDDEMRTEDMLKEIRQDIKILLGRVPEKHTEKKSDPYKNEEGYSYPPRPPKQARRESPDELRVRGYRNHLSQVR